MFQFTKNIRKQIQQRIFTVRLTNWVSNVAPFSFSKLYINPYHKKGASDLSIGFTLQNEPTFIWWNKTPAENEGVGQERVLTSYNRRALSVRSKPIHRSEVTEEYGWHFSILWKGVSWSKNIKLGKLEKTAFPSQHSSEWSYNDEGKKKLNAPSFRHTGSIHKPLQVSASRQPIQ